MATRRPKLDEVVSYRLAEMADLFTSGLSDLTGKIRREYTRGEGQEREQGEVVGRFGGVKGAFPELRHIKEGPGQIAAAIRRGSGALFDRVYSTVAEEFAPDFETTRKRSKGKPSVRPHKHLRRYCVHCRTFHTKDAHRFHGKGSFHRTHLWGFKNPEEDRDLLFPPGGFEQAEGKSKATLGRDEREAQRILYGGRRTETLRHGKTFDKERLESSPLFAPTRRTLFTNRGRGMSAGQTFAKLMATARSRKLTVREKEKLTAARQALRRARRPAMNSKKKGTFPPCKVCGKPTKQIRFGHRCHEKCKHRLGVALSRELGHLPPKANRSGGGARRRVKKNPAPTLRGRQRIGRIVELRYDRDTGNHRGFYKHTFKTNASVYILPGNQGILIR